VLHYIFELIFGVFHGHQHAKHCKDTDKACSCLTKLCLNRQKGKWEMRIWSKLHNLQ